MESVDHLIVFRVNAVEIEKMIEDLKTEILTVFLRTNMKRTNY